MKLKDISRTATFAWDANSSNTPLLATAAVAGALDENFSNESKLEIWQPDFDNVNHLKLADKAPLGSITVNSRFNRLRWSAPFGSYQLGLLAAGMETGEVSVYDPSKIIAGASADEARILKSEKHAGAVGGLDWNPIQKNLLLTGGINAQIYIFDLNDIAKEPITPGPVSTKLGEITSVQWNPTVARVFAASSSSGFASVWDVKAQKEIVSLQYGGGAAKGMETVGGIAGLQMGKRRGMSDVVWHPENPTRLITSSEDDESPIIMLWDLRNTRAPEKILSGHQKGVLSLSWCKQDADLLLSCGKDNRTLCWNPESGEVIGELPVSNDWTFQTSWCPRNPDLLATASFDGHIGIHSLQTTSEPQPITQQLEEGATPDDIFGALSNQQPSSECSNVLSLKQAPKWLRRPVSATFGFGGLLTTTSNLSGANGKHQSGVVHLRTITTEQAVLDRAEALDKTSGETEKLAEFCSTRASGQDEAWKALQTLFKANSRDELIQLLGFSKEEVAKKVEEAVAKFPNAVTLSKPKEEPVPPVISVEEDGKTPTAEKTESELLDDASVKSEAGVESQKAEEKSESGFFNDEAGPGTPAAAAAADFFSSMASGSLRNPQLDNIVPHKSVTVDSSVAATVGSRPSSVRDEIVNTENTFEIYPEGESDVDKLVTQALVVGDFKSAVDLCLASERFADALLLAVRGGPDLLHSTQNAYFAQQTTSRPFLRVFQSIVTEDLLDIVQNADLSEWKAAFVVLCTFAKDGEFANLAEQLGQRLQFRWRVLSGSDSPEAKEGAQVARQDATLCYLAAQKLEKVISIWLDEMTEEEEAVESTQYTSHAQALQSFIEKVSVFSAATGYVDEDLATPTQSAAAAEAGARTYKLAGLYDRYYEYADLLATQGLVDIAAKYVKKTPVDYKGFGGTGGFDKARERVLWAADEKTTAVSSSIGQSSKAGPSRSAGRYIPAQPAFAASAYGQSNGPYGAPAQQPTYQQAPVASRSVYQPSNAYAPPAQPTQAYENNPYAPAPSSYQTNAQNPSAPNGYGSTPYGVPQQSYNRPQVVPPPPRVGQASGPISASASSPPVVPGSQRRDVPGWNDAPTLVPKRPQSAAKEVKSAAIMSPFPNASPDPLAAAGGGLGGPSGPGVMSPPPMGGARTPVGIAPPPKGARPPSAASKAKIQPPPTAQQQQAQPQPQYSQPPQHQQLYQQPPPQQQQHFARPPPAQAGPPPSTLSRPPPGVRAGPPPGTLAGPPPPGRVLSPLNPARVTSPPNIYGAQQGQQAVYGQQGQSQARPPPPQFARPPSRPATGQEKAVRPPPPGSRLAGPPPPGRS
ncbi:protein transporter SEC31 [Cryptococcus wingfieldii CBS 7118]|uniref:Protein transport protein SEC31 n=1 Tax=Cryptococcus wingfieldii CBS 7118 TaxID=1295528 RepID=A0A1E3K8K9_9TREE|nr:protein transporter SEC31 [Cryptococcus wingfieldii CBS 7118]ODO08572.1 protein transporter SEC31 [Cryptococcus wingfieldii CBS 7118]